jgi:hypothetical protein
MPIHKGLMQAVVAMASALALSACAGGNTGYVVDGYASFPDKPGCPGFSVHFARTGNVLSGTAMRDGINKLSTLSGSVDGLNRFQASLTPVDAGGPIGKVSGVIAPAAGVATGTITDAGCNNGPVQIRFMPRNLSAGGSG